MSSMSYSQPVKRWLRLAAMAALLGVSASSLAAPDHMAQALNFLEKKDLKSAVIALKNQLQNEPDDSEARYMLGDVYLRLGFGEGAEKEFEQAAKLGIDRFTLLYPLGKAMLMQANYQRVLDTIHVDPYAPQVVRAEVSTLHGLAELGLNNLISAENDLKEAIKLRPGFPDALVGLARISLEAGEENRALDFVNQGLKSDSACVDCWVLRGELARKRHDYPSARQDFLAALDIEPNNFLAHLGASAAMVEMRDFKAAAEHLDEVRKIRPSHPFAAYLGAVVDFHSGKLEAAQVKLQDALRALPNHLPSLLLAGTVNYASRQYTQAEIQLSQYLSERPDNINARKLLASVELQLKNPERALSVLSGLDDKALEDPELASLIGNAYLQAGQSEKGSRFLEKAAKDAPDSPKLRTQLAVGKFAAGRDQEAISDLKEAIGLKPDEASKADILLILAHIRAGENDKAVTAARALAEKSPESPIPFNLMGAAFMGQKDMERARLAFEQALSMDPKFSVAQLNLARLDSLDGDMKRAKERLRGILDYDENNGNAMLELSSIASREGDSQEAMIWLERAWTRNTSSRQVGLRLGAVYLSNGEPLKAMNIARALVDTAPDDPGVLELLARSQLANGETSSAVSTYRKIVESNPDNVQAYMMLADALRAIGDVNGALAQIDELVKRVPASIKVRAAQAQMQLQVGRTEEAMATIAAIQKDNPENPLGFQLQGDLLMGESREKEALAEYRKAYALAPNSTLVTQMFRATRNVEGEEPAREILEQWLRNNPKDTDARVLLAISYRESNDPFGAIREYREILKVRPNDHVALNNLAILLRQENNPRAIEYAKRAFEAKPDSPAAADTYGWMLVQEGQADRAVPILLVAVEGVRNVPEVRYHYAFALYQSGDFKGARKELQRLMLMKNDFPGRADAEVLLRELRASD
ncbi:MAG: PEP-CTERM system TPR-repeat protein PrsT [Gammaproteobacteria bacterium]|nr:PEP-CTERM system TPR-repeat protein PrsT [Gammaproteobacteria bacterium]